jgi:hypothetical protein
MFVVNDKAEMQNAFFDAMESFEAPWLWHRMPRPFEDTKAILLPKSAVRSMRVAEEFAKRGFFDLGEHLSRLLGNQDSN